MENPLITIIRMQRALQESKIANRYKWNCSRRRWQWYFIATAAYNLAATIVATTKILNGGVFLLCLVCVLHNEYSIRRNRKEIVEAVEMISELEQAFPEIL